MTALRIEWVAFVVMAGVVEWIWFALRDETTFGWSAIALLIVVSAGFGVWFVVDPTVLA